MILRRHLERVIEEVLENADLDGLHYSAQLLLIEELTEEIYAFLEESEAHE